MITPHEYSRAQMNGKKQLQQHPTNHHESKEDLNRSSSKINNSYINLVPQKTNKFATINQELKNVEDEVLNKSK